mgnify:FL=1
MFAIVQTGGHQYRIEKGAKIAVEKIEQQEGADLELPNVLLVSGENGSASKIGQPLVAGAKVLATVTKQFRGDKLIVFKKRSKKGYKKIQGHRQNLTEIEIKEIVV